MVSNARLITNAMVKNTLDYADLIPAIERGLKDFSSGKVFQPVRSSVHVEPHNGYYLAMSAYNSNQDSLGMKSICLYPDGNPTHQTQILYFQPSTGKLLAIMDGEVITTMRTAAASAVATKYLAKENPKVLAILGAGDQAYSHAHAMIQIQKFEKIFVWNRTKANGMKLCENICLLAEEVKCCNTVEEAVTEADVIVTVTTSTIPILNGKHLKNSVHINCVGACRPDWRELDDDCMKLCDVYVDSREGAMKESGDIILSKCKIAGEIGEIANGKIKADRNRRTIFKSLGVAVEDVSAADLTWNKIMNSVGTVTLKS